MDFKAYPVTLGENLLESLRARKFHETVTSPPGAAFIIASADGLPGPLAFSLLLTRKWKGINQARPPWGSNKGFLIVSLRHMHP